MLHVPQLAAEPDGYTLYIPTITTFVIMPEVQTKLPFDMGRDFVHIGFVAETPMMIGVSPALGVNSLQEFIAVTQTSARRAVLCREQSWIAAPPHRRNVSQSNRRKRHVRPVSGRGRWPARP